MIVPPLTISSLAGFALAVISLTAGLAALLVMLFTRRFKDRIPLWFGLLSSIYGFRLLRRQGSSSCVTILPLSSHAAVTGPCKVITGNAPDFASK